MDALLEALFRRLRASSILKRLQLSYRIILLVMLIPVLVSVWAMSGYAARYHHVISQVNQVTALKPIVTESIPEELFSIVAGRLSFEDSRIDAYILETNESLESLAASQPTAGTKELVVARRAMNTLAEYVGRMKEAALQGAPVAQSEKLLEEVRGVAALVGDMLVEYNAREITLASSTSQQMQKTIGYLTIGEIALLVITFGFAALTQSSLSASIRHPLANLEAFAGDIAGGNLQARVPITETEELVSLSRSLNIMAGKLQDLIEENRREQENLKKSELRTLQAQIAPHFLYNTLDAIVWLAEAKRSDEVIQITKALSDFFRISLSQGRDFIPLSEEVRHLQGYLTIQKIRYRDILDYEIHIPEALYEYEVLKLLLQPLVENAIYHGIKHRRGRGKVTVAAEETRGGLLFTVRDSGIGIAPERLSEIQASINGLASPAQEEVGFGLYNVNKRIQLYYGQPEGLQITSDAEGTCVSFRMPGRRNEGV